MPDDKLNLYEIVKNNSRLMRGVNIDILLDHIKTLTLQYEEKKLTVNDCLTELARSASVYSVIHPNWNLLAGRLEMIKLKSKSAKKFSDVYKLFPKIFNTDYLDFVLKNAEELDEMVVESRDNLYNYFSVNVMKKTYLITVKVNEDDEYPTTLETPQYMWLRTAAYLYYPDLPKIKQVYDDLSTNQYTQATPTLCRAGYVRSQMASCFLLTIPDNMQGIKDGWGDSALISMNMGGLGKDYSSLRHSEIGFTGASKGVVPWVKIEAEIMKTVDQGGQKRKGSQTAFLCIWHVDIFDFIDMRRETTTEEKRALDMTYGVVIVDEFMRRVISDSYWTIMCPKKFSGLVDCYGEEFEKKYLEYEKSYTKDTMFMKRVRAVDLMKNLIMTQVETGGPFVIYKDNINRKTNQSNLGTIRTSNLCVEIMEYSDDNTIASCNLGSIALQACVYYESFGYYSISKYGECFFNFDKLDQLTRQMVRNINQVIDRNYYHSDKVKIPNLANRPIGIGVQSLADVFAKLDIIWGSPESYKLNREIFEVMYYAAVDESANIAIEQGRNYETFVGSPMNQGKFQFDLWKEEDQSRTITLKYSKEKWNNLREKASKHQYNSLLIALMPTASSASIFNNNECIEPFTQNIYTRSVLSGQFIMINKHLVEDFMNANAWNQKVIDHIINHQGSVQKLDLDDVNNNISAEQLDHLKKKYRTVFEISNQVLLKMAIDRGYFVCQSQSLNCWMKDPTFNEIYNWHMHGWNNGLKTGMYYLRTPATTTPTNVSLSVLKKESEFEKIIECTSCSS